MVGAIHDNHLAGDRILHPVVLACGDDVGQDQHQHHDRNQDHIGVRHFELKFLFFGVCHSHLLISPNLQQTYIRSRSTSAKSGSVPSPVVRCFNHTPSSNLNVKGKCDKMGKSSLEVQNGGYFFHRRGIKAVRCACGHDPFLGTGRAALPPEGGKPLPRLRAPGAGGDRGRGVPAQHWGSGETDPANAQLRFGAVSGWPEPAGRLYAFTSGNLSADLRTDPEADGQHP